MVTTLRTMTFGLKCKWNILLFFIFNIIQNITCCKCHAFVFTTSWRWWEMPEMKTAIGDRRTLGRFLPRAHQWLHWRTHMNLRGRLLCVPDVTWAHYHHGMARTQVAHGGKHPLISTLPATALNSHGQPTGNCPWAWGLGGGVKTFSVKNQHIAKYYIEPRSWTGYLERSKHCSVWL
jgi:hypothetical protein